jgi:hypothetical protein
MLIGQLHAMLWQIKAERLLVEMGNQIVGEREGSLYMYFQALRHFLSHLDDDLALCTSCFDVSQRLVGRFEWKDLIHNGADDPSIDQRADLA